MRARMGKKFSPPPSADGIIDLVAQVRDRSRRSCAPRPPRPGSRSLRSAEVHQLARRCGEWLMIAPRGRRGSRTRRPCSAEIFVRRGRVATRDGRVERRALGQVQDRGQLALVVGRDPVAAHQRVQRERRAGTSPAAMAITAPAVVERPAQDAAVAAGRSRRRTATPSWRGRGRPRRRLAAGAS